MADDQGRPPAGDLSATVADYIEGETGLVVTVPEAEAAVGRWRDQFDSSAIVGMPAHITVLYPFLGRSLIDADVISELAAIFAGHHAFGLRFVRCRRFPDVLCLQPEPESPLRALTEAVANRWPEAPPYGGQVAVADLVPHLTIAHGQDPTVMDRIEAEVSVSLPIATHVSAVGLHVHTAVRWREELAFPLS
jgi:2'-5' RNA ligase